MKRISVLVEPISVKGAKLIVPSSFCDGFEVCRSFSASNVQQQQSLSMDFAQQTAWELSIDDPHQSVEVEYLFEDTQQPLPERFWQSQTNRYTQASEELAQDVLQQVSKSASSETQIEQLITLAHQHFNYGHADTRFNDGEDLVPNVCGTTKGSCVDINTYLLAGAHVLNIKAQYVAGYWFHPDKTQTLDMHCWLLFHDGNRVLPWDLAHHMKWGVEGLSSGLNPAGGRRVPMSFGRGLSVRTTYGPITISHFSEPVWVLPDGRTQQSSLVIRIDESNHS